MEKLEESSDEAQQGQSQEIRPLFLGLNLSQDEYACGSMVFFLSFSVVEQYKDPMRLVSGDLLKGERLKLQI